MQKPQKILTLHTQECDLRAAADGWSAEDGSQILQQKEIGFSCGFQGFYCFQTPMHAIGAGWRLMAPPLATQDDILKWQWWFEK